MGDRVELKIVLLGRKVVEKNDRRFAAGEEVLQCQNLPAISQRALSQKT